MVIKLLKIASMACSYIKNGAKLISTNLDGQLPVSNSQFLIPDVGCMIKVVTACTNRDVDFNIAKPSTFGFDIMNNDHGPLDPSVWYAKT
jgi:ribonucleotide monophosphatase NagD (HAD superfamily)